MAFTNQKEQVTAQAQANQASQLLVTSAQLGATKEALATQGQALQTEQQRRMDAEKRAAQLARPESPRGFCVVFVTAPARSTDGDPGHDGRGRNSGGLTRVF